MSTSNKRAAKVLVVGGGVGGLVGANALARLLASEIANGSIEVTVIDRSSQHYYQPSFLFVVMNLEQPSRTHRSVRSLLDNRVTFVQAEVDAIDLAARRVVLVGGQSLSYDFLLVAPGVRLDRESIPGLALTEHFYSLESAEVLRQRLGDLEGGHVVVGVSSLPYKCPPAPLEMVLMLDSALRSAGRRDSFQLSFAFPMPIPFPGPGLAGPIGAMLQERSIEQVLSFELASVEEHRELVSTSGQRVPFDLAVVIPPNAPDAVVDRSSFPGGGWIAVDKMTLEVPGLEGVYALGDAAGLPTSKNGSGAELQAQVAARRIRDRLHDVTPTDTYDGTGMAFMVTGLDEAALISSNYTRQASQMSPSRPMHWMKLLYNELYWSLTVKGKLSGE